MNKLLFTVSFIAFSFMTYAEEHSLDTYPFSAGFLLPEAVIDGEKYILLGRESAGRDQGTFDSFGGSRSSEDGHDPLMCVAREFYEEAILGSTLGMDLDEVREYIDLSAGHTSHIFGIHYLERGFHNILCLTHMSHEDFDAIQSNFPDAWHAARQWVFKEKDALALVRYSDFNEVIAETDSTKGLTVKGLVTHLSGETSSETITLRPVLVSMMRCYIDNYPYLEGTQEEIRFYRV